VNAALAATANCALQVSSHVFKNPSQIDSKLFFLTLHFFFLEVLYSRQCALCDTGFQDVMTTIPHWRKPMIDTTDKDVLPLRRAGIGLPGAPGPATVRSWAERGVRGVILASYRIGGRRYTTLAALRRFLDAVNGVSADEQPNT
jgi:hypothetical protein